MSKSSPPASAPQPTFETALAELEALVAQMEAGQMTLDASLTAFARGKELERYCVAQLDVVREQLKVLEDGEIKPLNLDGGRG
jgi:exodeoxyribonuclease VII small subunit